MDQITRHVGFLISFLWFVLGSFNLYVLEVDTILMFYDL